MTTIVLAHPNERCPRFQVFCVYEAPDVHHVFALEEIGSRSEAERVAHKMMEECRGTTPMPRMPSSDLPITGKIPQEP